MNSADPIPLNARSLSYKYQGRRYSLSFDEEYLTGTWKSFPESQTTKTPLWRLLPELLSDMSASGFARARGRETRYFVLGAVVFYFSDINSHVPLLAPTLLLLAVWSLGRAMRDSLPLRKTKVITDYGEDIALIPHHSRISVQRKAFEQGLIDAIRLAREKREIG